MSCESGTSSCAQLDQSRIGVPTPDAAGFLVTGAAPSQALAGRLHGPMETNEVAQRWRYQIGPGERIRLFAHNAPPHPLSPVYEDRFKL